MKLQQPIPKKHGTFTEPTFGITFQATIGGKFTPLIGLRDEDMKINILISTYNTAGTDTASEIL